MGFQFRTPGLGQGRGRAEGGEGKGGEGEEEAILVLGDVFLFKRQSFAHNLQLAERICQRKSF